MKEEKEEQKTTSLSVVKKDVVKSDKKSMFSDVQEEMFGTLVEGLIPKIKPFIKPAVEKFREFLGDNEKIIVIRQLKGGSPTVFVLDNHIGDYHIENSAEEKKNIFTASGTPSPVKDIYDVNLFIEKLLTGELMKELKDKK